VAVVEEKSMARKENTLLHLLVVITSGTEDVAFLFVNNGVGRDLL
jgi:hypothetical protein